MSRFLAPTLLILLCGCAKEPAEQSTASEPALSRQYRRGSVTVILSVSETNITSSGKIQLMLDVQTPPRIDVVFPEAGTFSEAFSISGSYSEPQQKLSNGKTLHRQVWTLVPERPGEVVFQPLEVLAGNQTIQTAPLSIQVRSILPLGLDTFEIKDIAAPAALLPEQKRKQRIGWVVLGLAIATTGISILIRRSRKSKCIVIIPPHEAAVQALEDLPTEPIARIHELNRILREYIENRFNLPLIGKTTAEILPILGGTEFRGLTPRLKEFLEGGEVVRFSNRVPDGFTEEAERFVREFVGSTKEEPCD